MSKNQSLIISIIGEEANNPKLTNVAQPIIQPLDSNWWLEMKE